MDCNFGTPDATTRLHGNSTILPPALMLPDTIVCSFRDVHNQQRFHAEQALSYNRLYHSVLCQQRAQAAAGPEVPYRLPRAGRDRSLASDTERPAAETPANCYCLCDDDSHQVSSYRFALKLPACRQPGHIGRTCQQEIEGTHDMLRRSHSRARAHSTSTASQPSRLKSGSCQQTPVFTCKP